jgi:hypothetical protein
MTTVISPPPLTVAHNSASGRMPFTDASIHLTRGKLVFGKIPSATKADTNIQAIESRGESMVNAQQHGGCSATAVQSRAATSLVETVRCRCRGRGIKKVRVGEVEIGSGLALSDRPFIIVVYQDWYPVVAMI